jgi:uncharacterized protein YbgA (DUF1722 family)/uncharacterized protein YbbK (DUF523 family)
LVSRCIEFDHCRYNGSMISSSFIKKIKPFCHFLPVCPEIEIGLGVPRKSLRLVINNKEKRLIQPSTSKDFTKQMISFAESFLSNLPQINGIILKSRSPSCGIKDVKLYSAIKNAASVKRTSGLFGEIVSNRLTGVLESEGRLRNSFIQEHFLTSIFTLADFERAKEKTTISDLVSFHSKNKFLFMAYNQELLREMGRITANQKNLAANDVFEIYEKLLYSLFCTPPSHKSVINVIFHLFGFVSEDLNRSEKQFYLSLVDKYKNKKIPLSVLINVLNAWTMRFAEPYLSNQTFFNPFPEELMEEDFSALADRPEYW